MDLGLYASVLWRFRFLVLVGTLLAILLAALAMVKVTPSGLKYRQQEVWQSQSTLFITQQGFPWGRSVFPPYVQGKPYPYGDQNRFATLAELYAHLANSDPVKAIMARSGPVVGGVSAQAIPPTTPNGTSPLVSILGSAPTALGAVKVTQLGTDAFLSYLSEQQSAARIPKSQRIDVSVLQRATPPLLVTPRKKTLPVIVFLAVMTATIGLAFILENARPRVRALPSVTGESARTAESRRSASA